MTQSKVEQWECALNRYCYPVDLATFEGAAEHPGWFQHEDSPWEGDLASTADFENRFRGNAERHIEAWYEVVFWKNIRRAPSHRAREVITKTRRERTTSEELYRLCRRYVETPSRETFEDFRKKLFRADVVATAATFPAFLCPDRFPMVDTKVAEWARCHGPDHSYEPMGGPALAPGPVFDQNITVIRSRQPLHWDFVESWIEWCRYTAGLLTEHSGRMWSAREVEMAIFTAPDRGLWLPPLNECA